MFGIAGFVLMSRQFRSIGLWGGFILERGMADHASRLDLHLSGKPLQRSVGFRHRIYAVWTGPIGGDACAMGNENESPLSYWIESGS